MHLAFSVTHILDECLMLGIVQQASIQDFFRDVDSELYWRTCTLSFYIQICHFGGVPNKYSTE